jgi:Tol biopolymer transport system component
MNRTASHAPLFRTRVPLGHGRRMVLWGAITFMSVSALGFLGARYLTGSLPFDSQEASESAVPPGSGPAALGAPAAPAVNPRALPPDGRLAFVWHGRLYLLDSPTRSVKLLARRGAVSPALSSDGNWVAHLKRVPEGSEVGTRLWIRSADGKKAHRVTDLPSELGTLAWSPASSTLAVTSGGPEGEDGQVWIVKPGESSRRIATTPRWIPKVAWRPDGKALAYVAPLPAEVSDLRAGEATDALFMLELGSGAPGAPKRLFAAENEGIELAGWWPDGRGLLFWRNPEHSASLAADGLDLFSLRLADGAARKLATTLVYPEWISWAPDGRRVLLVSGPGRESSDNKSLATCDVSSGMCATLPQPAGTVALDPAWSPSGDRISFVRAARQEGLAGPWGRWTATRRLWTAAPDGSDAREVETEGAVFGPVWSRDGRRILFLGDGALWLADPSGGTSVRVVSPFPGPSGDATGDGFYYGFFPLDSLSSWWQG